MGENLDKHSAKRLIVEDIRFQMIQEPVEVPLKSWFVKKGCYDNPLICLGSLRKTSCKRNEKTDFGVTEMLKLTCDLCEEKQTDGR